MPTHVRNADTGARLTAHPQPGYTQDALDWAAKLRAVGIKP
jgi:hypothetical protein